MKASIYQLADKIEIWLTTGIIEENILKNDFYFSSPYWKNANKDDFLQTFKDPSKYISTSLSKIRAFDPIIHCFSEDFLSFTIIVKYHTLNGASVDEVVVCTTHEGKIQTMLSVYDLDKTKAALELE